MSIYKRVEFISFCLNGEINEPVFENSMFTDEKKQWNKHLRVGLHSERGNKLQMDASADSTELWYSENKFVLNKFPSRYDGCFFYTKWEIPIFLRKIPLEMINHLYIPITKSHW